MAPTDEEREEAQRQAFDERREELNKAAAETFEALVRKTVEAIVLAKIRGKAPPDPDKRRRKRRERDKKMMISDALERERAGLKATEAFERSLGARDYLRIDYFVKGLVAARAVGRLDALKGAYFGSGFLCAPGMVMTNNHVLPDCEAAVDTNIGFETYDGAVVLPDCDLDPDHFFWTSKELDVTIVALDRQLDPKQTADLGWHPLLAEQGKIATGDPAAIIQYPRGRPKSVVLHDAKVVFLEDSTKDKVDHSLWYTCDTEPGSSGSPVFNKHWEVVALHHAAVPAKNEDGDYIDEDGNAVSKEDYERDPDCVVYQANEGIRVSRIVAALTEKTQFKDRADYADRRDEILAAWKGAGGQRDVLQKMRRKIVQEWAEADDAGSENDDNGLVMIDGKAPERGTRRHPSHPDLVDDLLDRVGENGSLEITLRRNGS